MLINDDFNTPVIYQDLANSTMRPMNYNLGGMYRTGPSLLNGVQMQSQLSEDKVEINKAQKAKGDGQLLKNVGLFLLGAAAIGFIPSMRKNIKNAGGIGKFVNKQFNKISNWGKNLFNGKEINETAKTVKNEASTGKKGIRKWYENYKHNHAVKARAKNINAIRKQTAKEAAKTARNEAIDAKKAAKEAGKITKNEAKQAKQTAKEAAKAAKKQAKDAKKAVNPEVSTEKKGIAKRFEDFKHNLEVKARAKNIKAIQNKNAKEVAKAAKKQAKDAKKAVNPEVFTEKKGIAKRFEDFKHNLEVKARAKNINAIRKQAAKEAAKTARNEAINAKKAAN